MIPRISIKSLTFNDKTLLALEENDIVIFVGANNVGKSACLKEITRFLEDNEKGKVLNDIKYVRIGQPNDIHEYLKGFAANDSYSYLGATIHKSSVTGYWQHESLHALTKFFVAHLKTESRLTDSNPAESIALALRPPAHPIHIMQRDDMIEARVSKLFRIAFGTDLMVHRNAGKEVPLYCGKNQASKVGTDRSTLSYCKFLEGLDRLNAQGDGMRAFVSVLLNTLIEKRSIVLIDEPEAFLHPPQAKKLGRMLVNEIPNDRQVFIATHSGDFLHGILSTASARVRIVRLDRNDQTNLVSELCNTDIKLLWNDPLLRQSNILDGLFHKHVVVCEADTDARFYAAMGAAVIGDAIDEVMFTHCGGKDRLKVVVSALRKLNVPVSVICDFDIFNEREPLMSLVNALSGEWSSIEPFWNTVKKAVDSLKPELSTEDVKREVKDVLDGVSGPRFTDDARKKVVDTLRRASPWGIAKATGSRYVPRGEASLAYNRMNQACSGVGLFVVECGELECFAKTVPSHGTKWVNGVLERDLKTDPELGDARAFIAKIINR